jgi:hypothetical protein
MNRVTFTEVFLHKCTNRLINHLVTVINEKHDHDDDDVLLTDASVGTPVVRCSDVSRLSCIRRC